MTMTIDPSTLAIVHQALIENGYDCGTDPQQGIFGPTTQAAVRAFQAAHRDATGAPLAVDGVVGPKTLWALEHPVAGPVGPALVKTGSPQRALAALDGAITELEAGVAEDPMGSNRGPRVDVYTGYQGKDPGTQGPPWCAFFVSFNFGPHSPFGVIEGAQAILAWAERAGYAADPAQGAQKGDIFVIRDGPVHGHCGHVYEPVGSLVRTVEGNSANRVRSITRPLATIHGLVRIP